MWAALLLDLELRETDAPSLFAPRTADGYTMRRVTRTDDFVKPVKIAHPKPLSERTTALTFTR